MKKSEALRKEGHEEENDLKAMGFYNKALRENRFEKFEENWLPKIKEHDLVLYVYHYEAQGKYTIDIRDYGLIDFYPKANKVLVRHLNRWKKPGLRFLLKLLFHDKN